MSKPSFLVALFVSAAAAASAPTTTTTAPSLVTATGAQLNGSINPNGESTIGWFRLATTNPGACDDVFGSRVPGAGGTGVGNGINLTPYSVSTTGLLPGTQYWVCAISQNPSGTTFGSPVPFTTPALPPTVMTISATNVTSSGGTLSADANPNGAATTAFFRYSTSSPGSCNASFGTRAPVGSGGTMLSGNGTTTYNEVVTGLLAGTTYYYCAIATNAQGTTLGNLLSFTTLVAVPTVTTSNAAVSGTSATLVGTGNPNGSTTTAWFRYAASDPGSCNDAFGTRTTTIGLGSTSGVQSYTRSVTGLAPGTQYWFCAIAQNGVGTGFGQVLTFTTPNVPSLVTQAVSNLTSNSATFNGTVNPNNSDTWAYYRYSTANPGTCNDSFGSATVTSFFSAGSTALANPISSGAGAFFPGTTYYYCAVAYNGVGTGFGQVLSFTTPAVAPTVSTTAASTITGVAATLNASTNPGGATTTAWFRYATVSPGTCNDTFGTRAPAAGGTTLSAGNSSVGFAENVTALSPGTTYYFCGIAQNSVGLGFGAVRSFTTPSAPTVFTGVVSSLTGISAQLNGSVNPNGGSPGYAATAFFRWSATNPGSCNDTFGTRTPAGAGTGTNISFDGQSFAYGINGLTPGTTYWYCALASNVAGTGVGTLQSFVTPSIPTVTTLAQTSLLPNSAQLNGTANPNGASTSAYFRFSTTNPVTCSTSFSGFNTSGTGLGSGNTAVSYSMNTNTNINLSPGTTYYYCAIANNVVGDGFGAVLSFTTPAQVPVVSMNGIGSVTGSSATLNGLATPRGDTAVAYFRYASVSPGTCNDTFGTRVPAAGGTTVAAQAQSSGFSEPVTGLAPGTTYYVCALAANSVGTGFSTVTSFTTPNVPTVTTAAPSVSAGGTSAQLNGSLNSNLSTATGFFRYDTTNPGTCNDTFGTRAPGGTGGTAVNNGNFTQSIFGLTPGTTYFFCALGTNIVGTGVGSVLSFQTPAIPTVTTVAATGVTANGATLNATALPNGAGVTNATGWFRYSTTNPGTCNDSFGTRLPSFSGGTFLGAGSSSTPFTTSLSLLPGNTYYYCAIASNGVGTGFGTVLSVVTPALAPSVDTFSVGTYTSSTATLPGQLNPNGAASTGWFRYSTVSPGSCNDTFGTRVPATGGTTVPASNSYSSFDEDLTGLSLATRYYYCAIASSSVGTTLGVLTSFTTSPTAPTVTTLSASSITTSSATLNATAVPNGSASIGWFRFFTSDPGSCNDFGGTRFPGTGGTTLGAGLASVPYSVTPMTLQPGVTYWYCALASNSVDVSMGAVLTFKTASTPPTLNTLAADNVGGTTARLNGSVNPNGDATTGWHRYSTTNPVNCNDTFGTRVPATGGVALGSGSTATGLTQVLTGLTPGVTYYFCAIAQNSVGTTLGLVLSFSTPNAPAVTTNAATPVTATTATLNANAVPNGTAATGWFRYSATDPGTCDDAFGTRLPATGGQALGNSAMPVAYQQAISSLSPGTQYFFCAIAQNSVGTSFGALLSFFTPPAPPAVTPLAATAIGAAGATLNATVNPSGAATTVWVRVATASPGTCNDTFGTRSPSSGGTAVGSGTANASFAQAVTGLSPGTTYYGCVIAQNGVGTTFGGIVSFITTAAPTVVTGSASSITTTSATLAASANPNRDATTGWLRYDTVSPGSCNDTFGTRAPAGTGGSMLGNGSTAASYTQPITGLSAGTTYYYCAIASNAVGSGFGTVQQFTTPVTPTVVTLAPTTLTGTSATLAATGNPNGTNTTGWFRWYVSNPGTCSDVGGTRVPAISGGTALGSGMSPVTYTQSIAGLSAGNTYWVCGLASNAIGTAVGAPVSFTTLAPPVVTTTPATGVTTATAQLEGTANPRGAATTGWFRWATTNPVTCNDTFGTRAPASSGTMLGSGTSAAPYTQGITGLAQGTTYYFCAIASNSEGTRFGAVQSFTTPSGPVVTTSAASPVGSTTATLNGMANPRGDASTGWFRWSNVNPGACSDAFGTRAPSTGGTPLGSGTTATAFSEALTGLTPSTTYFFCAIAQNPVGTSFGAMQSFVTPSAPSVTTNAATSIGASSAALNGTGVANNAAATAWFRISPTDPGTCDDAFGTRVPSTSGSSLGSGTTSVAYTQTAAGLSGSTTYFFCAIAQNSVGTSFGAVRSFTTPAAPTVTTTAASAVTGSTATLNGSANPNGSTATGWFRYSLTNPVTCNDTFGTRTPATGGTALGAGTTAATYLANLTGLASGSTYYFCAIASNTVGTSFGTVQSFATAGAPQATSLAATGVSASGATLNGTGTPSGDPTTGYFRWSQTSPGTCNVTFGTRLPASGGTALGSGSAAVPFSEVLTGLAPATTYYYCAFAGNSIATGVGTLQSFTTTSGPAVTSSAASAVTSTGATLNGSANPRSDATSGWFRYGAANPGSCNDTFGTRAPSAGGTALGSGAAAVPYSENLTALSPGTTYFFCAIARSSFGTSFGALLTFTTPAAPTVVTSAASGVTSTGATLNGSATPNGALTTGWLRYDTVSPGSCNDTFGTRAPASGGTSLGAGSTSAPFSQAVTGLAQGTTYFFCAVAQNAVGTSFGPVLSFTTPSAPGTVTSAASAVSSSGATLNGSANPNGLAATGWFRWSATNPGSCTDAFGTRAPATGGAALGSGLGPAPYTQAITGLAAGATYYFCAIAQNSVGLGFGAVLTFTAPTAAPSVTTNAVSSVTGTDATLNGSANPGGDATLAWFRFSNTNPVSCDDTFGTRAPLGSGGTSLGSGSTAVGFSQTVSGLNMGASYYYCAIAQNARGTSFGTVQSFVVPRPPVVTTSAPSAITGTTATFNGSVNPGLAASTAWFRYSSTDPGTCDDTFGTRTPATGGTMLAAGGTATPYSQNATALTQGTRYWVCAIASNAAGTAFGSVLTFRTPSAPAVTTSSASNVTGATASLNGVVNPNGGATIGWFRFSTVSPGSCNDTFGTRAPASSGTGVGGGSTDVGWAQGVTGLAPARTYFFCAIAQNAVGTSFGQVLQFNTAAATPMVSTQPASDVTGHSATLNGAALPNSLETIGWFRLATADPGACSDTFGTRVPATAGLALGAGTSVQSFSLAPTDLEAGTKYWYCAIASNMGGAGFGTVVTFTTPKVLPQVTTVSSLTEADGSITINGEANPNGAETAGFFRYDVLNPGVCTDSFGTRDPVDGVPLGSGGAVVTFSRNLSLTPGTYYFCAGATNEAGTVYGEVRELTVQAGGGCGCSSSPLGLVLLGVIVLLRRRRSKSC